jgi:hypothetical protein
VYVHNAGPNRGLATAGYRIFRHLMPPGVLLELAITGRRAADLAHDGALAAAQAPTSPRAAFLGACASLAARDAEGLSAARQRLAALIGPDHPSVTALDAARRRIAPPF